MKKIATLFLFLSMSISCFAQHQVNLKWQYVQGADAAAQFKVFRAVSGTTSTFTAIGTVATPTTLTYVDKTVVPGSSYIYYIVAVDVSGNYSVPTANLYTTPNIPAAPVSALTVAVSSTANTLNWTASIDAANGGTVSIGRASGLCGSSAQAFTQLATGLTAITYTDSNPPAASAYCYTVVETINGVSASKWINAIMETAPISLSGSVQ